MAGTNITWTIVAVVFFIGVVSLAVLAQQQFEIDNTWPTAFNDSQYNSALANLSSTASIDETITPFKNTNLLTGVWNIGVSAFTTAVIAVQALFTLATFPSVLNNMFQTLSSGLSLGPAGIILFWVFSTAAFIYLTMKLIKSIRGTIDET